MKIQNNLSVLALAQLSEEPIALTIGNFDGVHLGHQAVLKRLKASASQTVVFTFSNHPAEVLHNAQILRLTTLAHRLALLEQIGIDHVIIVPFTQEFASQSAEAFLATLKKHFPFTHLILGHDSVIGHDRKRDLQQLCGPLAFSLEYLPSITHQNQVVSSSAIRRHIQAGELAQAGSLLGRPYSIVAIVQPGHGRGKEIGFHTANLPVEGLALPPFGVYAVQVNLDGKLLPAVANLGHAPTIHTARPPCLEVHLINEQRDLYGQQLEVIFQKFIRPEKRFDTFLELQAQIREDIGAASGLIV